MAASRGSAEVMVNYICQQCSAPLNLDGSFDDVDEIAALTSELGNLPLSSPSPNTSSTTDDNGKDENDDDDDDTVTLIGGSSAGDLGPPPISSPSSSATDYLTSTGGRRYNFTPPICRLTDSGNGFMLVGDSSTSGGRAIGGQQDGETGSSLGHMLAVSSRLFDIISDQSDVDHPLCEECTDTLLDELDQMLKVTEDEYRDYQEFLERFEEQASVNGGGRDEEEDSDENSVESLRVELETLAADERRLLEQLASVENEKAEAERELKIQSMEMERLRADEEHFLREYFVYKRQLLVHGDEQRSVDNQLRFAQTQLDRLKKTNVFNASFHIWHSGHFGTINNFRLGRLPSVPVEWSEINAAWGQTVLLLHSLANKIELTFQRYRLVPYGNHSYVECIVDRSRELPLYGSGGIRFFWDTKFDQAMVAFLDCLQQFKEEVERGDTGFCLPYKMDRAGHIEGTGMGNSYSVKTQFNSEEQWTKALKFMLTNLKWGLAWVSAQFVSK